MEKDEEIRWEFIIISPILPSGCRSAGRLDERRVCIKQQIMSRSSTDSSQAAAQEVTLNLKAPALTLPQVCLNSRGLSNFFIVFHEISFCRRCWVELFFCFLPPGHVYLNLQQSGRPQCARPFSRLPFSKNFW